MLFKWIKDRVSLLKVLALALAVGKECVNARPVGSL